MKLETLLLRLSAYFRLRRMRRFIETFPISEATRILDVGGEPCFWGDAKLPASLTLLNTYALPGRHDRHPAVIADGCSLPFPQRAFDIAFSNSVIEHLGTFQEQRRFAEEIRNVAGEVWIQTPARWFPVEPHLGGLFIHYLPKRLQRKLARWVTLWGWMATDYDRDIDRYLKEVRLLTAREMKELFPDCEILKERWLGLTKSYIAVRKS